MALRAFRIFSNICGDICKSRCTTGINDTGGKFAKNTARVVDTSGKFTTIVNDTGSKFSPGVNDTGGKMTPVASCHRYQRHRRLEHYQTADTLK
jgi:hypothetical protein